MIYVDYTDCVPVDGIKVHGGAEYARRMLALLSDNGMNITVLIPDIYTEYIEGDKELFSKNNIAIKRMNDIATFCPTDKDSILFIPLMATHRMKQVVIIKENNPKLPVYVTIHGTRLMDLKPDKMDYYYENKGSLFVFNKKKQFTYFLSKLAYKRTYKRYIPKFDGVITVSNDSMQKIQNISSPQELALFFEGTLKGDRIESNTGKYERKPFFLFVSGGRPEKNLLRTLVAFQAFKRSDKTGTTLTVTGMNENVKNSLLGCKLLDSSIIKENVSFLPYIDESELDHLYRTCRYVLYPSKSEGFGLPLVDAVLYGVPCLTSSITATPEILGSAAIYVNPYSADSIANGMRRITAMDYPSLLKSVEMAKERVLSSIKCADDDFVTYMQSKCNGTK